MPTNLPPDYFEIEKRFREAQFTAEKISLLEEMISVVPKHKGTDHLRADLRRQLSRLKEEAQSKRKSGSHQSAFYIEKEGAGQAAVIGATNTGKSSLVRALTNAEPEVSPAPYTTWRPTPGMMPIENILVQLVDTPPLDRNFVEPGLFDLVRRADLVLLVVDLQADPLEQMEECLELLAEHRIFPIQRMGEYEGSKRPAYLKFLILANKWDGTDLDELCEICQELIGSEWTVIPISAETGRNFDVLKKQVYSALEIVRVYARPPGKEPDLQRPFVLKQGSTVEDLAAKVHRDFFENLKSARVWGSTMFDGQMVKRDYVLQDGDSIELRT